MLLPRYFQELFAPAFEAQTLQIHYSDRKLHGLGFHWTGGLSLENGIAAAEKLMPSVKISGQRDPNGEDALRASRHLETLLAGCSLSLGSEDYGGDSLVGWFPNSTWAGPRYEHADLIGYPWRRFRLGTSGITLAECFLRLCNGESTAPLEALTLNDIARGLADPDAGVRDFAFGLLSKSNLIMTPLSDSSTTT